jgi:membrane protease YdiL (CAAX protease family)
VKPDRSKVQIHSFPPPGWYPDPYRVELQRYYRVELQRYWDGTQWTSHTVPSFHIPTLAATYPEQVVRAKKSWGLGDVALGLGAFFFVSLVLGLLVAVVAVAIEGPQVDLANDAITLFFLIAGGVGSAVAFLGVPLYASYRKGERSLSRDFGLRFTWLDPVLGVGMAIVGLAFSVAVSLASNAIFGETPTNTGGLPTSFSGPEIVMFLVVLVVVAGVIPFVEELFFRGLMLRAIQKRFGVVAAVVGSTVVFGLAHITGAENLSSLVAIPIVTGVYGLIFALVTVKTNRLGASIIAHTLINATAVLALFA